MLHITTRWVQKNNMPQFSVVTEIVDHSFWSVLVRIWRKNLGFGFGFPAPACWSIKAPRDALQLRRRAMH